MSYWEFWDYVEISGKNPFASWFSEVPVGARAHMDARMLIMEGMQRWPEKWASDYKGVVGLLELRLPFQKVQYRPLFCHSPHVRRQLVILAGAVEKGGRLPKQEVNAAVDRLRLLKEDSRRATRHRY